MEEKVYKWSDTALTISLLAVAAVLVVIALWRHHPIYKAITLAWVILP